MTLVKDQYWEISTDNRSNFERCGHQLPNFNVKPFAGYSESGESPYSQELTDLIRDCLNPYVHRRLDLDSLAERTARGMSSWDSLCQPSSDDAGPDNPIEQQKVYYKDHEINDMPLAKNRLPTGFEDWFEIMNLAQRDPDWPDLRPPSKYDKIKPTDQERWKKRSAQMAGWKGDYKLCAIGFGVEFTLALIRRSLMPGHHRRECVVISTMISQTLKTITMTIMTTIKAVVAVVAEQSGLRIRLPIRAGVRSGSPFEGYRSKIRKTFLDCPRDHVPFRERHPTRLLPGCPEHRPGLQEPHLDQHHLLVFQHRQVRQSQRILTTQIMRSSDGSFVMAGDAHSIDLDLAVIQTTRSFDGR